MNFAAHGLQRTWPQGTVKTALMVLLRPLLQAGQTSVAGPAVEVDLVSEEEVLKLIGTRDFRDKG